MRGLGKVQKKRNSHSELCVYEMHLTIALQKVRFEVRGRDNKGSHLFTYLIEITASKL